MSFFGDAINFVLSFLPDSPIGDLQIPDYVQTILGYANYFLPINEIITTLELWCAAILVYYLYSAILRFVKAID